jgi:hypothetical protein
VISVFFFYKARSLAIAINEYEICVVGNVAITSGASPHSHKAMADGIEMEYVPERASDSCAEF